MKGRAMKWEYWVEGEEAHLTDLDNYFDTLEVAIENAQAMLYEDDEETRVWVRGGGRKYCKARVFGNGKILKLDY